MKFRLIYEGEIAPRQKTNVQGLHRIRKMLHPQIKNLWQFSPLDLKVKWLCFPDDPHAYEGIDVGRIGVLEKRGNVVFAPLVSKRVSLQCELDITFLRKQPKGFLVGEGGDIDNRIKTLLDALAMPPLAQQEQFRDEAEEEPIFCLLQDDSLVTKLSVETDRLLRPTDNDNDLIAIIGVNVTLSKMIFANIEVGQ